MTSREKLHELLKTSGCPTWFQDNCLALADEVRRDAIRECIHLLNTADLSAGAFNGFVAIHPDDYIAAQSSLREKVPGYDMDAISSEFALSAISKLEELVLASTPDDEEAQRLCAEGVKKCAPVCHHFGSNKKPGPVVAAATTVAAVDVGVERMSWVLVFGVLGGNKEEEQSIREALADGWIEESRTDKKISFTRPKR